MSSSNEVSSNRMIFERDLAAIADHLSKESLLAEWHIEARIEVKRITKKSILGSSGEVVQIEEGQGVE
jgi:hypothetical protein